MIAVCLVFVFFTGAGTSLFAVGVGCLAAWRVTRSGSVDLVDDGTGSAESSVTVSRSKFSEAWSTLQRDNDDDDDVTPNRSPKVDTAAAACTSPTDGCERVGRGRVFGRRELSDSHISTTRRLNVGGVCDRVPLKL
jgi:hypothetical protein